MNVSAEDNRVSKRKLTVAGRVISVSEFGQGPALLLLHGGGAGASGLSNYGRNIEALSQGFRVIVPDMPGYGDSSKGLDRIDPFGDLAQSMFGLLDALGVQLAHVVGNSLGGACALRMALERPHRIDRMVLMGPGGIGASRGLPTPGLKKLLGYYKGEGPSLEKLRDFIRNYLVFDASGVSDALIQQRYEASIDPAVIASPPLQGPKGLAGLIKMDLTRDARLATLKTPPLVLWGAEDRVNKPAGGEYLRRHMPNCDLYLFAKTGHWIQWERAEEFNAITASFLLARYAPMEQA